LGLVHAALDFFQLVLERLFERLEVSHLGLVHDALDVLQLVFQRLGNGLIEGTQAFGQALFGEELDLSCLGTRLGAELRKPAGLSQCFQAYYYYYYYSSSTSACSPRAGTDNIHVCAPL
jgi:hypothetical protein